MLRESAVLDLESSQCHTERHSVLPTELRLGMPQVLIPVHKGPLERRE